MFRRQVVPAVSLVAHIALGFFPYLASGLIAPAGGMIVLAAIWVALLLVGLFCWRQRPLWTPLVPVSAAVLWVAVITIGEAKYGWTA